MLAYTSCNARGEQTPPMHTLHRYIRTSKPSWSCIQCLTSSVSVVCCFQADMLIRHTPQPLLTDELFGQFKLKTLAYTVVMQGENKDCPCIVFICTSALQNFPEHAILLPANYNVWLPVYLWFAALRQICWWDPLHNRSCCLILYSYVFVMKCLLLSVSKHFKTYIVSSSNMLGRQTRHCAPAAQK